MANIQEPCNLRSNARTSNLVLMASDPEQILRSTDETSFSMKFQNPRHSVQEPAETLEAASESYDEGPSSKLIPTSDVPMTFSKLFNHQLLCASLRRMAQENAGRMLVLKMDISLIKAAEEALSYALHIGYEEDIDGLKHASFNFCGQGPNRNGLTWCTKRHVQTKSRETDQVSYVRGHIYNSRLNIF